MPDRSDSLTRHEKYREAIRAGREAFNAGDFAAAILWFNQAIDLMPLEEAGYLWRGRAFFSQNQYAEALADFRKAVQRQPDESLHWYWQGRANFQLRQWEAARRDLSRAIALAPENDMPYYWRGCTHMQQKKLSEAQADLDANANAVLIQSIKLENEGWERDYEVTEPAEVSYTEP